VTLCPQLRRLQAEHARWLAALGHEGDAHRAARLLALWEEEIQPHCRREEEVLLPELSRRIPEADAVIVFTLGDHVVLRRLVRELRETCEPERGEAADRLAHKLVEHLEFEEKTLFPAAQESLGCDRLAALARELATPETESKLQQLGADPAGHRRPPSTKGERS
jgi:hemerythrin-like domain-containing protein